MSRRPVAIESFLFRAFLILGVSNGVVFAQERNEYAKLTASDALDDDFFGASVSISGDTMVVGAYRDDCVAGVNCGSAYVFKFNGVAWVQQAKLTASDMTASDVFGVSVSVGGDTIVVGTPRDDCVAGFSCGSAYVFVKPGGGWTDMTQTAKLTASDADDLDQFGKSVSISGDTIVAAAFSDDCVAGIDCGAVYVYAKPGGGWTNMTQTAKLTASDSAADDYFGVSVAISGNTVVVGANNDDVGANPNQGSAYVYVRPAGPWSDATQTAKLTASEGAANDYFGESVAISGDTVVVGDNNDDIGINSNQGSAYVFVRPGSGWINMAQTAKLTASDGVAGDEFGKATSISGDTLVVGTDFNNCAAGSFCGSAYVFVRPGGGWSDMAQNAQLTASDAADSDYFGLSVSLNEGTVVVGSFRDDCVAGADCGAAYVFHAKDIIYVDGSATGLNDGSSWDNAHRHLRDAIAPHNREVWVAAGTYRPDRADFIGPATPGDRSNTFQILSGQPIYGGFNGTETLRIQRIPTLNTTILSGDLAGDDIAVACIQNAPDCDSFGGLCVNGFCIISNNNAENSYHVATGSWTDATAILDGFTIRGGNANGPSSFGFGAGMNNISGSPTVTNCAFVANSASGDGAGMFNSGSSPTVSDCLFRGNSSVQDGGGMYTASGDPTVIDCTFSFNSGRIGGGMHGVLSSPTVTKCMFFANRGTQFGGGMTNGTNSLAVITNCAFIGNSADNGGGMNNSNNANPVITNCLFSGNTTVGHGGAMYNRNTSNPAIVNCTFSGNSAFGNGGGIYDFSNDNPTVTNSVLWGNVADADGGEPFMNELAQIYRIAGTPTVNYSIVQGGWTGAGGNNSSSNPLLFDPDGADGVVGTIDDNLRLRAGSPAIDAANELLLPPDSLDLDGDSSTSEPIPFDLAGNARLFDTNIITAAILDMGAYEYFPDCNHNGIDDATDIANQTSEDCDASAGWAVNGIPDECDIETCPGLSACDDCNQNGVPDRCDIVSLTSADADSDLIPDECVAFTDSCAVPGQELFWTCGDNWPLGGDYPDDNDSAAGVFVTLPDGVVALLNETVVIPSLRIGEGAELQVTQSGGQGDLLFSAPAVFDIEGSLLVSGARSVGGVPGVAPAVTVGPEGVYEADPSAVAGGAISASLTASTLSVVGSDCFIPPCPHGGEVTLTDSMSLTTTGDLIIDGSLANGECQLHREGQAASLSFHTPPSIRVIGTNTGINVGAAMALSGAAGFLHESLQPVTVGGDWNNQSVRPDCFEAIAGTIRMDGGAPQWFEVAATDSGGTGGSMNDFRMRTLEIGAGRQVTFEDQFDNDLQGQASCGEAQYVGTLVLEAGSTITVQNCRLYYDTLVKDPTAQIVLSGCGEARAPIDPESALSDPTGLNKARAISFAPPSGAVAGGSAPSAIRVTLASLHHVDPPYTGGPSIPFTSFEGEIRWVGPPSQYVESSSNATPFQASALQCSSFYHDWGTISLLHVFGSAVVPSSSYRVQFLAETCLGIEDRCTAVSPFLTVNTARWADVETPYNPPDLGQPAFSDISALVAKFRSAAGAPIKARALLAGDDGFGNFTTIQQDLSFTHIAACVDAFRGKPYPHTIAACP